MWLFVCVWLESSGCVQFISHQFWSISIVWMCIHVGILSASGSWSSHGRAERVKLTTSWTVAAPLERRRSVSLPFTILPSFDFGALVLIPIMSNAHKQDDSISSMLTTHFLLRQINLFTDYFFFWRFIKWHTTPHFTILCSDVQFIPLKRQNIRNLKNFNESHRKKKCLVTD